MNRVVGPVVAPIVANDTAPDPSFLAAQRSVSVIMVVYMTGAALGESIACALQDPMVSELVIVDNGSTTDDLIYLRTLAEREAPRVTLMTGHGNVGFAKGANLGARAARGEVLLFLNPDAFLQPGCVEALVEGLKGQPPRSIVGACILDPDGREQRGGRRGEVSALSTVLTLSRASRKFRGLDAYEIHRNHDAMPETMVSVPTISGACFAARREDFKSLGGFDEGYFLHVEDIDLCWRARRMGGSVVFAPEAQVVHLGSTSRKHPLVVEYHKGRGLTRYFRKRADTTGQYVLALILSPLIMMVSVLRPAMRSIGGRSRARHRVGSRA